MTPNTALLSLEQTPPLAVPLRFFLVAPLAGMAAALLALYLGPEAMVSRWQPGVLAFTHLLTLGYLLMVMMGAMLQMLPVLVGVQPGRPLLLARVVHALLIGGTVLLVVAFLQMVKIWFAISGILLALALGLFIVVIGKALWQARSMHDTVTAMRLALLALGITLLLGLWLVLWYLNSHWGREQILINLHLGWGLLGWVGLLILGVAYQVVPMFQITREYHPKVRYWQPRLIFLFLVVWSLLFAMENRLAWLAALGIALTYVVFALLTLRLQHRRLRRLPDVTVDFWKLGLLCLLLAAGLWLQQQLWPNLLPGTRVELWWGILLIPGTGVTLISGMLYKIVPFLVWLHMNNRLQEAGLWQGKLPTMRQIIIEQRARRHLYLHGLAMLLLLGAVLFPWLFHPAMLMLAASFAMQGWNLLGALRTYRGSLQAAGL